MASEPNILKANLHPSGFAKCDSSSAQVWRKNLLVVLGDTKEHVHLESNRKTRDAKKEGKHRHRDTQRERKEQVLEEEAPPK